MRRRKSSVRKFFIQQSPIQGNGVFAARDIKKGERILYIAGQKIKRRIKNAIESKLYENWIGTGKDRWLNVVRPYRYLNHSCDPNAAIAGRKTLVALRNIRKNKEITFDYSLTDDDEFWEMNCNCGTKQCRKIIKYVRSIDPKTFKRHYPHVPTYFQRTFIREYILNGHSKSRKAIKTKI